MLFLNPLYFDNKLERMKNINIGIVHFQDPRLKIINARIKTVKLPFFVKSLNLNEEKAIADERNIPIKKLEISSL